MHQSGMHDHTHHHHHHYTGGRDTDNLSRIRFALILNFTFTLIEIAGGLWTNSMAVLSDALHDLGDTFSLGLSYFFEKLSHKKRDQIFSYGYRRFSLLSAMVNGLVLIGGALFLITEIIPRFTDPQPVNAPGVILLAVVGIIFNGIGALRLMKGSNLNERMLSWHLLEDVLGWVALLVGGIFMYFFHFSMLDPILSLGFILFTLWNVMRMAKQTLLIFLQSVPGTVDLERLEKALCDIEGVHSVHDTHVWSMDGDYHVLTTHIVILDSTPDGEIIPVKQKAREVAHNHHVEHATIEVERVDEQCHLEDC